MSLPYAAVRYASVLLSILMLTGCGNNDKEDIHRILDSRDRAVSTHDIKAYSKLLMDDYAFQGKSASDAINNINLLFQQFDMIQMQSSNRVIRYPDDMHAQCEQNYLLRVKLDNEWRKTFQRERILLTRTDGGWKISGGL